MSAINRILIATNFDGPCDTRAGAGQRLLGSVARDVSRTCRVPVLTIQDPAARNRSLPVYS
ncbi:MAG: hypothetical protein ABUL62_09410 [Myxococcales bacterium]